MRSLPFFRVGSKKCRWETKMAGERCVPGQFLICRKPYCLAAPMDIHDQGLAPGIAGVEIPAGGRGVPAG